MKKNDWVSAADLMAELQADPEFVAQDLRREQDRLQRQTRIDGLLRPVLEDLKAAGIVVNNFDDLVPAYAPLPPLVVEVLLDWIDRTEDEDVLESLIRALAATEDPYDGVPLAKAFDRVGSDSVRWAIGNTLARTSPTGIERWLVNAAQNQSYGTAREMLVTAVGRLVPPEEANPLLRTMFVDFPVPAAQGVAFSGGVAELRFLEAMRDSASGWLKKEFDKSIKKLRKKLSATKGKFDR